MKSSPRVLKGLLIAVVLSLGCQADPAVRKQRYVESGSRYFDEGKYSSAVIEYRNAVDIDPKFGAARKRLAESYAKAGDAGHALEEYVRAADLLPDDVDVQITAGTYLLAARKLEEAATRADAALARQAGSIQAHLLRGNALAGLSSFDEALESIEEAIRLDPSRGTTFTHLGAVQMVRGRRPEAEAAFLKAVALAPDSIETHLALGNFYWSVGKAPETERAFRGALRIDPNNRPANRALAAFTIATGRYKEAEPFLIRMAESGNDAAAVFALSDYYLAAGRPRDAIARLEAFGKTNSSLPGLGSRLARAYAAGGDAPRARTLVEQVLAANPGAVDAQLLKGQLLLNEGNRNEALESVRAAVTANPSSAEAQFALGRLYAARGDARAAEEAFREVLRINPRAAAAQVEIARLQLSRGNQDVSLKTVEEVTRSQPDNAAARLTLIRSLMATKDLPRAERELEKLKSEYPKASAVHVQAALLALLKNDAGAARTALNRAQELEPKSLDLLAVWVALDLKSNNATSARSRIEQRLNEGPNPAMLLLAARTYWTLKDQAATERVLRRAIEADPSLLQPYEMLGQLYLSQQKLDQARSEFEAVARRQTKPVGSLTMVGVILLSQGQNEAARKRFEEVLELDPNAVIAANNLAWIMAEEGSDLDSALKFAQTAAAQAPEQPEVLDTLGWVYYRRNLPEMAIPLFQKSVERAPNTASYSYHLGLALAKAGKRDQARAVLQRALAADVRDKRVDDDIRKALAGL